MSHDHEIGTMTTISEPLRFWCRICGAEFEPTEKQIVEWKTVRFREMMAETRADLITTPTEVER